MLFLVLFLFTQSKELEIWAKITTQGVKRKIPITIADLNIEKELINTYSSFAQEIKKIIINDLDFSLYFKICYAESNKTYSTDEKKIDFKGWRTTGADILICGDIFLKKKKVFVRIKLYELNIQKLIAKKEYEYFSQINLRHLAHKISDDIIKILTGNDGVSQTKIAFLVKKGAGKEIMICDYDGYNLQKLTNDGKLKLSPDWSKKGDKIIYSAYDNNILKIYLYELNTQKTKLLYGDKGMSATPTFSSDDKYIAFSMAQEGNMNICLISSTGGKLQKITYTSSVAVSPSFSPSDKQIVFCSDRSGTPQIYIVNIDGTNLTRLTYEGSYNTSPNWSPKGDLIVYVGRTKNNKNQIFLTDVNGSFTKQLTFEGNNEDPYFSSDGLHIVFSSDRTGSWEIYTMHYDGSNQKKITNLGNATSPTWSPIYK
ncbi:MAG: Tol-Pal system beta propeller repeat protein TolB [candidate division WOR-3 bacterium]